MYVTPNNGGLRPVSVNTTSAPSAEILHRPSGGVSVLFAAAAAVAAQRRSHYIRHRRAARRWAAAAADIWLRQRH